MSGLKNSPFGKRVRATQLDDDHDAPRRTRPRVVQNPFMVPHPLPTPDTTPDANNANDPSSSDSHPAPALEPAKPPHRDYGDRFVPKRDTGDLRTSYNLMDDAGPSSPNKTKLIPTESDAVKEQANALFTSILHSEVTPPSPPRPVSPARPTPAAGTTTTPSTPSRARRLFTYAPPGPSDPTTPTRRLDAPTDEAYSLSPVRASSRALLESPRRVVRPVCKTPYRVLDAPDLADDFYLNLVDWSSTNVLAVGLGPAVYLWTAHTAAVSKLCDLGGADTVSALAWVDRGSALAVGTLGGRLHVYDARTLALTRSYAKAHAQRLGALAWSGATLCSGSRDRAIHFRDVRQPSVKPFRRAMGHRQEVCGLRWAGDGRLLASGGNDNKVCIWDVRGGANGGAGASNASGNSSTSSGGGGGGGGAAEAMRARAGGGGAQDALDAPLWKFHEHTAAVKALAWDPHVAGVLASGGGTQDKHIRFWNVQYGTLLSELDTGSQVCNLTWSRTSHEIVSTHGFSSTTAQNQICIWRYPALEMVAALTGHTSRVLYLAMSPDGETIVTGAGDETLRFWNAFPRRDARAGRRESALDYGRLIR